MAVLIMAAWRFALTESGAQCAMINGITMMLMLRAVSLASLARLPLHKVRHTVRVLVLSGWMTYPVKEERPHYLTVHTMGWEDITVITARMQVWFVSNTCKHDHKQTMPDGVH